MCYHESPQIVNTWLGNTIGCHFLPQQRSVEVFKWAAVIFTRPHAGVYNFDTTVRRIVNSLSFLAVVMADSVRILFFKLTER